MNFLKSGWNSVLGNTEPATQPSVADTIEKLIERVETSTLLEDRRDACRALKSLAKTYRLEVGAQGMNVLINVLLTDTHDNEIISYTLDALCYIITGPQEDPNDYEGIQSPREDTEDLGIQFTEIFAKRKENVAILIDLLGEFEFKVRWPALKLLTGLLRNKLRYIQDLVLEKASGIPKIMDLLQDIREIIRNDAILLLVHLTRSNPNIQKIVTFENAFDKLFDIIASEGYTDGGVVVEDCLIVCQNLLKNNTSNQIFFREGNYLLKLLPFLDISDYINWCPQKETNVLFLLYLIRTLVSPTNPPHITAPVQKSILQCGLFGKLCEMLLIKGIPEIVLSETINTVGESIRGDNFNQKYFYNINTLVDPPKPILVVLLMSMINEKQSFILRCAILYCFQCFLYRNEFGQARIIQTLLPSTVEASEDVNVGQLLCSGLFSQDSISQWFVTVALSHLLIDNKAQKEQLLRVQLATDVNSTPIPLFTSCCTLLQESTRFHSKLGLLILLCTWLSNCTFAVIRFLEINTNVPFLISQITIVEGDDCDMLIHGMCAFLLGICIKYNDDSVPNFSKEDMLQLLNKRIGIDAFIDKINKISNHETYSATLQKPLIKFKTIDDVLLDHEFCKLFKSIENEIVKLVKMKPGDQSNPESSLTDEQHKLLIQYKSLIRDQDLQITHLRKELIDLSEKYKSVQGELVETKSNRDQLKDELALIKQTNSLMNSPSSQDQYAGLTSSFLQLNLPQDNFKSDYTYNPYTNSYVTPANQPISQPSNQPLSQPVNHSLSQPLSQPANQYYSYPNAGNYSTLVPQVNHNSLELQSNVANLSQGSSAELHQQSHHSINLQSSNNLQSNLQSNLQTSNNLQASNSLQFSNNLQSNANPPSITPNASYSYEPVQPLIYHPQSDLLSKNQQYSLDPSKQSYAPLTNQQVASLSHSLNQHEQSAGQQQSVNQPPVNHQQSANHQQQFTNQPSVNQQQQFANQQQPPVNQPQSGNPPHSFHPQPPLSHHAGPPRDSTGDHAIDYSYQSPQYTATNLVQSNGLSNDLQSASDELQSKIDGDNLKNQTKDSLDRALNSISQNSIPPNSIPQNSIGAQHYQS